MLDTVGALQTAGYDLIQNVNTDDPQTAVVTFSEPYGAWRELFGVLLPGHVLGPDTNIAEQWNDAITVSGGPWLSQSWSADRHILIPNPNYWVPERRPLVDRVVMVPMESTEAQVTALQSGQVMAALPQPFPGFRDRFTADLTFVLGEGTFVEGFWINQQSPNDGEVDNNPRLALVRRLAAILAEDVPWIPLYVLPNLLAWNSTMVESAGAWVSSPYSGFYDWTVISPGQ